MRLCERTFTWRALHWRHPNRLFLWPRRGIEVSLTSQVTLEVALPQSGWVTLDAPLNGVVDQKRMRGGVERYGGSTISSSMGGMALSPVCYR